MFEINRRKLKTIVSGDPGSRKMTRKCWGKPAALKSPKEGAGKAIKWIFGLFPLDFVSLETWRYVCIQLQIKNPIANKEMENPVRIQGVLFDI